MDRKHDDQDQLIRQEPVEEELLPADKPKKGKRKGFGLHPAFRKIFRKHPLTTICVLLILASLVFCIVAPLIGKMAGGAHGSYRGVTVGIGTGINDGKDQGLSAEDTVAIIGTKMAETGKLQVMLADLKLSDIYQQGPETRPQYAALITMEGEGVFTVDLTQAKAVYDPSVNQINITIPEPEFTPYLDDSTLETLAEYQPRFRNGSISNGYKGYLNTRSQINQKAQEEMKAMMEPARTSAVKQVELLAKAVCGSIASVHVSFAGGEM